MGSFVKMIQFETVRSQDGTYTVQAQYNSFEPVPEWIRSKWNQTELISCKRSLRRGWSMIGRNVKWQDTNENVLASLK